MLTISYSRQAIKQMRKLDMKTKSRIEAAVDKLAEDPRNPVLDIKKLQGREGYRLRVGTYRVVYGIDGKILDIFEVDSRGSIY